MRSSSRRASNRRSFRPGLESLEDRLVLDVSLNLVVPPSSTYGVNNSLVIEYANTGPSAEAAPLLVLSADNADLWLPTDPTGRGSVLQLLAASPTGPAGTLAPGTTGTIEVNFTSTVSTSNAPINFTVKQLQPAQTIDWASLKTSLKPAFIPADAWDPIFANFTAAIGSTTDSYQAALDADATYLGQFGTPTTNVGRLLAFEINKANNSFATPTRADAVDASLPTPGPALVFSRSFQPTIAGRYQQGTMGRGWVSNWDVTAAADSDGNVTITAGGSLRTFLRQSDGSYLPILGDHGTLTSLGGGAYQVKELSGDLTVFNANGTLNYVQDTNGNRVTATYTSGRLTKLTATNGAYLTLAYTNGKLTTVADSTGRNTTYTYDASGQHLLTSANEWGTTRYNYVTGQGAASENALASITFADNTHQFFTYDAHGRPIEQHRDNDQEAVSVAYASPGGTTVTDAFGARTTLLIDDLGQVRQVVNAQGQTTTMTFNPSGDLTAVNGPLGTQVSYTYDLMGNVTSATDPLGQTTRFTYDGAGRLLSYKDARNNTTGYGYDARGNLLSITYPNNSLEQFQYDPVGNLTRATNARGRAVVYTPNSAGQILDAAYQDGTHETYTYNNRGQLLTATNPTGTITFRYQNAANPNLVTRIEYPNSRFLQFQYNVVGQRTQSVDQTGFTINYAYDAVGRLQKLTDGGGNLIVQYAYDAAGQLVQKDLGNGTRTTYQYDALGNLVRLTNLAPDHVTVNSRFDYTYDALGRVATMTTGGVTTTYGYDAAGQLTALDTTGLSVRYTYDAAGNRLTETVNGVTTRYTANNVNQYTAVAGTTYQYDADGNLISMTDAVGTTTYAFNDANQLTGVTGPGLTASYTYDPLGIRNAETVNGTAIRFLIDPFALGDVVSEYTTGGSLVAHYTQGIGLTSRVSSAGTASYYDFDHTGNTVGMTDASGTYVNRYNYLPFGKTTTLAAALPNPFTFVGQAGVMSDGNGLFFMRARTYDSVTGQFLSNDPLGLNGGDSNVRRYVSNNPVTFVDPVGLGKGKILAWIIEQTAAGKFRRIAPILDKTGVEQAIKDGLDVSARDSKHFVNKASEKHRSRRGEDQRWHRHGDRDAGGHLFDTLKGVAALVTAKGILEGIFPNNAYASGAGDVIDFFNPLSLPSDILDIVDVAGNLLSGVLQPGASGTTNNTHPNNSGTTIIEGTPMTLRVWTGTVGEPVTSADVRFTNSANPSDDVSATSVIIKPTGQGTGQYAQYSVDAIVTFHETGVYGVTVVVNGRFEVENPHRESVIVYDAPWIVNPVNFTVPIGGVYHGPIATFYDPNPFANPAYYSAGWVNSATLIPATIEGGGGFYTVIGTIDYSRTTRPGSANLYVRVWDVGPGPNPKGGADVFDNVSVVGSGDLFYSTSVQGQIVNTSKMPGDPPLVVIDTTASNITSLSQVGVTVEPPSNSTTPVPLITGMSMTRLGGITRIMVEGVVSALQPGAGPTVAAPLRITLPGQPTLTSQVMVDQSLSEYTLNAMSVVATSGQPLQNVPVAILEGPANGSYAATIDWGDGEVSPGQITALGGTQFRVSGSKPHAYASAGTRIILVTASGPGTIPASSARIMASVIDPSVPPPPGNGGGGSASPAPPPASPAAPRGISARLVTVKMGKRTRQMAQVFFADTGALKTSFVLPFQAPACRGIRASVRDGNGDGVPDQVVITAMKGRKPVTATFLG